MSTKTIVGFFKSPPEAQHAVQRLIGAGIPGNAIQTSNDQGSEPTGAGGGFFSGLKELFSGSRRVPEYDRDLRYYEEGLRRGGVMVTVTADEPLVDDAADIL